MIFQSTERQLAEIALTHSLYMKKSDSNRILQQKKQYDYYSGTISELEEYLSIKMKLTWSKDTVNKIPFSFIRLTKKVVDSLCSVYIAETKRKIYKGDKENTELTDYYNSILPDNVNTIDKRAHRLAKLHEVGLSQFIWNKDKQKFDQIANSSWIYNVVTTEDPHIPDKISFFKEYYIPKEKKDEVLEIVFTDTKHYALDSNKRELNVPGTNDKENIYGVKPFVVFRTSITDNFWGNGMSDLVEENELLNALLSKLNYDDIIMGTAGVLLGIDLGDLSGNAVDVDEKTGEKRLKVGRDTILRVETGINKNAPSVEWISTNSQITEVMEVIDWKIKIIASSYGLNPNNFSMESKAESGFSKLIDSVEQMENRISDIDACRKYEIDRFNLLKTMNNKLIEKRYDDIKKLKKIPDDVTLKVDFPEIVLPMSKTEVWEDREKKMSYNIISVKDIFKEENPDYDEKEIETKIKENKKLNDTNEEDTSNSFTL